MRSLVIGISLDGEVILMTRDEMIEFLNKNPNVKVSHFLFDSDEYIYQKNGYIYDESGYLFEDWFSERSNGLRMRTEGLWEDGWYIKDDHKAV